MPGHRETYETEAKEFFATVSEQEREETRAFQLTSLRSLARDDDTDGGPHGK